MTLLHWKYHLHAAELLGPNSGQISTYALFAIMLNYIDDLVAESLPSYEQHARRLTVAYLGMVPHVLRTEDPLCPGHNLTSRAYLSGETHRERPFIMAAPCLKLNSWRPFRRWLVR